MMNFDDPSVPDSVSAHLTRFLLYLLTRWPVSLTGALLACMSFGCERIVHETFLENLKLLYANGTSNFLLVNIQFPYRQHMLNVFMTIILFFHFCACYVGLSRGGNIRMVLLRLYTLMASRRYNMLQAESR